MKLDHFAITVNNKQEIENFYHNILGMKEIRNFSIDEDLSREIFDIDKKTPVFLLQKDELLLEVFVSTKQRKSGFDHICISIKNRETLAEKAVQSDYKCSRIKRINADLIFIKDNYGNIFEIKELMPFM